MPLAEPTLTITDLADGTGVTATIAGGDGAATNTIRYQRVDGELGTSTWTTLGSQVGNGTTGTLAAPVGLHWFRCDSVLAAEAVVGNLVYAAVTSGDDAVLDQIMESSIARIQLLNDPWIGNRVYKQVQPSEVNIAMPCCIVSLAGLLETDEGGTNIRDDVGYPLRVDLVDRASPDDKRIIPLVTKARQSIQRAFRQQRLPGVPETYVCRVEPAPIYDPELPAYQIALSSFVLRFVAREVRGFGA